MIPAPTLDAIRTSLQLQRVATRDAFPKVTARVLYGDDLDTLIDAIATAAEQAAPDDVRIVARAHGGILPNSYKWAGDGDTAEVSVDLRTGAFVATLARKPAPKRPNGRGPWLVVRVLRDGQADGRIVVSR